MHPLKRAGAKGEGKFERISWDEALDTLADRLKSVKETYGNASIFLATGGGYLAGLHNGGLAATRLLNQFGGCTTHYGNISSEGAVWASLTQYGSVMVGNSQRFGVPMGFGGPHAAFIAAREDFKRKIVDDDLVTTFIFGKPEIEQIVRELQ